MSASMSFNARPATQVTCHDYGTDRPPILNLWSTPVSLTITGDNAIPIEDHLAFARNLAAETASYLAAMERFAATDMGRTP
ncbi:hypothetical protein [Kitasatospora arboriphila]|uniref:Uncharacterized protein n=1 Tax=Kitasatospora arboriphila TaxID=258052 RepID=A0ABN1TTI0_9ACTN